MSSDRHNGFCCNSNDDLRKTDALMIKRTMINNPATIEMSQFLKTQMKIVDKAAIRNKKNVT